ncbi:MAG TPA: hypothetical protein DCF45_06575 [Gammaproteobacteria bacterium]|nr:hypothetical protein [Gammaproteobacteria bacterium]
MFSTKKVMTLLAAENLPEGILTTSPSEVTAMLRLLRKVTTGCVGTCGLKQSKGPLAESGSVVS